MVLKNGVKNIQTAGYNGARTVPMFYMNLFGLIAAGHFMIEYIGCFG